MIYTKPSMVCLFLHQVKWHDDGSGIVYCEKCDKAFYYPSVRTHHPVYRK